MRRALITGATGQDSSYLAELLLEKGYEVWGIIRRASTFNTGRIDHIFDQLHLVHGDMLDQASLVQALQQSEPHEIYNLAAQSHVAVSFQQPEYTAQVTGLGLVRLLEAVRFLGMSMDVRIYQASSSEMFGTAPAPQDEMSPFRPQSPYAIAKIFAHRTAQLYREACNMWIACGILFNHSSTRRGETFVERKITRAVARIKLGMQDKLALGNLEAKRDWGWAPDYVRGMWQMLQQVHPVDIVLATGETHSVRELCQFAFDYVGLDYRKYVVHDERHERPAEVPELRGVAACAKELLSWEPTKRFAGIVEALLDHDLDIVKRGHP